MNVYHTTAFQAEILAITAASFELVERENVRNTIRRLSNSQTAIQVIWNFKTTSKVVIDCKKTINKLTTYKPVEIIWIPDRCNIDSNEEANRLVSEGSVLIMTGHKLTRRIVRLNRGYMKHSHEIAVPHRL